MNNKFQIDNTNIQTQISNSKKNRKWGPSGRWSNEEWRKYFHEIALDWEPIEGKTTMSGTDGPRILSRRIASIKFYAKFQLRRTYLNERVKTKKN